jgi:4-alpha-glucanotransferase
MSTAERTGPERNSEPRSPLDDLAARVGIEPEYLTLKGETRRLPDAAKRATLAAMGIPAGTDEEVAAALQEVSPAEFGAMDAPAGISCFVPEWLKEGRTWGVACQLYSLRSHRNWGIGDFEDLGRFAEIAAVAGADFVGVNPLHALFLAAPERCSPFAPSNRLFLNPLYIAVENVSGFPRLADALQPPPDIRETELVDYRRVASLKRKALDRLFRIHNDTADEESLAQFEAFCLERGQALYLHALFESLSEMLSQQGHGATWHGWPDEYRHPGTDSVRAFARSRRISSPSTAGCNGWPTASLPRRRGGPALPGCGSGSISISPLESHPTGRRHGRTVL